MVSPESQEIKSFLDEKYNIYNRPRFIESDPILIPHQFTKKEDIEIAGFLTATISWGQRKSIISNARKLMDLMGNSPHDFIINHATNHLEAIRKFVHRTFNGNDCVFFIKALHRIYSKHGGLENIFTNGYQQNENIGDALIRLKKVFLETMHEPRSEKHLPDILKGSAAKRLNMYLRWMVRQDARGVDFGIWKNIDQAHLLLPLDVHTGNVSRKLHLLARKQNDWKAVTEVTNRLKDFDPHDPVKYDFALFGLGIFEGF